MLCPCKGLPFVLRVQPEHTSLDIYGIFKNIFCIYKLLFPFVSSSSSFLQPSAGFVHFADIFFRAKGWCFCSCGLTGS